MANRPNLTTDPLNWADGGGADVVDPGLAKQDMGWVDFEPVNNGHLNEMMRRWGEFLIYLDNSESKHFPYVKGTGNEGLPLVFSGVDLSFTIDPFTCQIDDKEFEFSAPSGLVTTDANLAAWVIYVDPAGVIQAAKGVFTNGIAYDPKPLPDGVLLTRFLVQGGDTDHSTPPTGVKDLRARNAHGPYRLVDEAFDKLGDLEVALVWDPDTQQSANTFPGSSKLLMNSAVTIDGGGSKSSVNNNNTVAVTGTGVVYAGNSGNDPVLFSRELNTVVATFNWQQTNTSGPRKVVTDGLTVVGIHDTFVEAFDVDGTPTWDFDHTAALHDVWLTKQFVYICGAETGGGISLRKLNRTTGAVVYDFDHGATAHSVWSDDKATHLEGLASTHATGATFRIINENGHDVTGEGGIFADATFTAVDDVAVSLTPNHFQFVEAPDGQLYRAHSTGALAIISEHGRRADFPGATGVTPVGRSCTCVGTDLVCLSVDQDFIYFQQSDAVLGCIDRKAMRVAWLRDISAGSIDRIFGIATDGQTIFIDRGLQVGITSGSAHARGNKPTRYQKFANPVEGSSQRRKVLMHPID